ncbi:MAG: ATP-binding protein [Agriterribacter sp.]
MTVKRIYCLLVFFSILTTTWGQGVEHDASFTVQHYTDEDGLPQNSVKSIIRDMHGFVWMTTEDGLVRFDGKRFFIFGRGNELRSSRFWSLTQDWLDKSFYAFNQSGEALRISKGKAERDSSYTEKKIKLFEAIPWLHLPDSRFGVTSIPDEINGRITISPDTCIIIRPNKRLFVYTRGIITQYVSGEKSKIFRYHVDDCNRFFCLDTSLFYLRTDGYIINITGGTSKMAVSLKGDLSSSQLKLIAENQQKFFWNNTDDGSLVLFSTSNFYHLTYIPGLGFYSKLVGKGFNAIDNKIICALYDKVTCKLFAGSSVGGLYIFSKPSFSVISLPPPVDNVYYGFTVLQENKLLTAQGVITNLEGKEQAALKKPLLTDKYSFITDSKGFVWTKKEKQLLRMHPEDLHILQQWDLESFIYVLYEGKNHKLYIGCANNTIQTIDLEDAVLKLKEFCSVTSIPKCIFQTSNNELWVGMETGLCKINLDKRTQIQIKEAGALSIRSLYGENKELWITTYEHGFFLLRNGRFSSFPLDEHGYLLTTHCIVKDKKGFFWITTNKGLFKTSKADLISFAEGNLNILRYQYYSKEDGFLTNEFNGGCQPCGLLLPNGWLSFPSMNGLVLFNPDSVDVNSLKNELFVDKVLFDGKEISLNNIISVPRRIRQIKILVSSPDWGSDNSRFLDYAFLKDSDTLWLPVDNDNSITLSTLPWGDHVLVVRKTGGFEKERFTFHTLRFTVEAPWFLRYESIVFFAICMILLIWGFIRWRTKWIRSKNILLEQKVSRKTNELKAAFDALQISADELALRTRIQEKMIASISHDVKVPMGFLRVVSEDMHAGLQSGRKEGILHQSRLVKDHVARLYFFMQNLLDYSKSQMGSNFSLNEEVNLTAILQEKKDLFSDIAIQTSTQLTVTADRELIVLSNRILLGIVIHNLIDNAIKVSEAGIVEITACKRNNEVLIYIKDSGSGFPDGVMEWLNDSAKHNAWERPGVKIQGTGVGLYIVKDLVALLDIKLTALNSSEGATITLFTVLK